MKLVIRGLLFVVALGSIVGCGQQQPQNPNFVNGAANPYQFQQNPYQQPFLGQNPYQNPYQQPFLGQNPYMNPYQNPYQNPYYRTW